MKADAKRVRDKIRRDHESWLRIDAATVTSGEFSMQWLAERENDVSGKRRAERTLASNRLMVKRLCEVMGGVRLAETTPRVIEAALNEIRSGGKLSETTVYACYALIRQLMNATERNDLVLRNPCNCVEAPKKEKPKRLSLTSAQARELNAKLAKRESELWVEMRARRANVGAAGGARRALGFSKAPNIVAVRIGLYTSMRLGEVFGLEWKDISGEECSIRIERALTNGGSIKKPKSESGTRTIFIDRETVRTLDEWKAFQAGELSSVGVVQTEETPVCCSTIGGFGQLGNFESWWARFRCEISFEGLKFHELRHTQATQMLARGVDVKTVQNRLGRASAALTLNTYAHALPENDRKAAAMLGNVIRGDKGEARILKIGA